MKKVLFTSDELPAELDDAARFRLWRDIYTASYGAFDLAYAAGRPFAMRSEFAAVGGLRLAQASGTIVRFTRTAQQAAADKRSDFMIGINRSDASALLSQRGREQTCRRGQMMLSVTGEPVDNRTQGDDQAWIGLCVPYAQLVERVAGADDLVARPLGQNAPAVRHLGRYLDFVFGSDEIGADPALIALASETLLDLAVLALGAKDDAAEAACGRGLRAARIQKILSELKAGFSRPEFSAHEVARKLGLSARYVQELMQDTGASFTERVIELRLQHARAMLMSRSHDRFKVSDIAFSCGFNEVSYFNRRFRRRFGASPMQFRGRN